MDLYLKSLYILTYTKAFAKRTSGVRTLKLDYIRSLHARSNLFCKSTSTMIGSSKRGDPACTSSGQLDPRMPYVLE